MTDLDESCGQLLKELDGSYKHLRLYSRSWIIPNSGFRVLFQHFSVKTFPP